jgi:uncharacterized repeat protein (TIGR01451 family)
MTDRRIFGPLAALAVLTAASSARAQYAVDWWTTDGGGVTGAAGGPYRLDGTAGQPDAGGPFAGGTLGLHSGFWSIAAGGGVGVVTDLAITKSDGQASAVPGAAVTYTIVAANNGPAAVTAATVSDAPPATLGGASWTCTATAGSACPASGTGAIAASVDLAIGGTATFTLTGTIDPAATGTLTNGASIAPPSGVLDPLPANNLAEDLDTLTPRADLALAKGDAPDPVAQGGTLVYTLLVTNAGPSRSPSAIVTDTLPSEVAFVSSSPGPPTCGHASGVVSCVLGALDPGGSTSVTITVATNPSATALSNTAIVAGGATDPVPANDSDTEPTSVIARADGELTHGTALRADLASLPGGVPDEDRYRIHQQPYASYEVVVDETSGDLGAGSGPLVERLGADGTTVVQTAQPAGAGPSRSLRWENQASSVVTAEVIRVRSASCTTDCGADDVYRLRAYETTYAVARFNNSGSQITVLLLQNPGVTAVSGHAYFWSPSGTLLGTATLALGPHQLAVVNTAAVPGAAGQSGTITVTHDGRYGDLVGKTVALEPATGFSFDSPLVAKPR